MWEGWLAGEHGPALGEEFTLWYLSNWVAVSSEGLENIGSSGCGEVRWGLSVSGKAENS